MSEHEGSTDRPPGRGRPTRPGRPTRSRRRLPAAVAVVLTAGVLSACSGSGGASPHSAPPLSVPPGVHVQDHVDAAVQLGAVHAPAAERDPAATDRVVRGEQELTVRLLDRLGTTGNVSVSPLSLYVALGMLRNGAAGGTDAGIAKAMQLGTLSATALDRGLAGLSAALEQAATAGGVTLESADSLWAQRGFPLRAQFLSALQTYYRTGVWQVDFATAAAKRAIDAWTSRATHGRITSLFDRLDPATVLVLADAVYFHADWALPFDPHLTDGGTFTTARRTTVQAKFLTSHGGLRTSTTGDYEAVQLPYRGGRFAALAVMPTRQSLAAFVHGLDGARLAAIAGGLTLSGRTVSLPRFTTTSKLELGDTLRALGMTTAFTSAADFSALSPVPTQVTRVVQRVYLGVGEKGTTAAAATGQSMIATGVAAAEPVRLDHPFLFLVRDTLTGAVLFASAITDPSAG